MRYRKQWNLISRFVSLTLLLLGCLLALRDGMLIDWWKIRDMAIICILVSAGVTVIHFTKILTTLGSLLGLGTAAGVAVFAYEQLQQEWLNCYYHVIPLINSYYRTNYFYQESVTTQGDSRIFLLFVTLLLGLWMGAGCGEGKRRLIFLFPVLPAFSFGLLLGYAPGMGAVLCLLGGLGARMLLVKPQDTKAERNGKRLGFLCLCTAAGGAALVYRPVSDQALSYHEPLKAYQLSLEDQMLEVMEESDFLSDLFWRLGTGEQRASLTNRPPRLSDKRILTITTDERPIQPIYMKNFTGVYYDKGVWYPAPEEEFETFSAQQQMNAAEYGAKILTIAYDSNAWEYPGNDSQQNTLTNTEDYRIQIEKRTGYLTPYPYYAGLPQAAEIVGDSGIRITEGDTYQVKSCQNFLWKMGLSSIDDLTQRSDDLRAYGEYAARQCTQLPEGQLTRLREHLEEARAMVMENEYRYSLDLKPVPEGQDIVEYFLFEQKKGYCMHFASARTLILRMYGIPARYASGYLVRPGDFKENRDGTYTAVVTEQRAHAWVELYDKSTGWTSMEVTPSDYYNGLLEADSEENVTDIVSSLEETYQEQEEVPKKGEEKAEKEPKAELQEQEERIRSQGDSPDGDGSGAGKPEATTIGNVLRYFLYWIFGAGVVILIVCLRVKIIWKLRKQNFQNPDKRRAAAALVKETLRLLKLSHICFTGNEDELVFARETEASLNCFGEGEFVEFIEIARTARYGNHRLTEGQLQYLYMIYKRIRAYEERHMKWYGRIFYRYIRVLLI